VPRAPDRSPPRWIEYRLADGWIALVGRTDLDSERLSLEVARPNDFWFHVRGMPGGHVVLRARDDAEPDRRTLEAAASLAVWHSKARGGGTSTVSCARARDVSKPRGAPVGTVRLRRETTLAVRPPDSTQIERWSRPSVDGEA